MAQFSADTDCFMIPTTDVHLMPPIDLLMSGGGYRATLFHLGVLRFLYEHEDNSTKQSLLSSVKRVIGVSGGSITAAHFAMKRDEYERDFDIACQSVISLIKNAHDIRRALLVKARPIAESLKDLFGDMTFAGTAADDNQCRVDLLAADYKSSAIVVFGTDGIQIYDKKPTSHPLSLITDGKRMYIRFAIAASSAFPPFFPPLVIDNASHFSGTVSNTAITDLREREIADGGIRDNLGLEYYLMSAPQDRLALVSDAGYPFDWSRESFVRNSLRMWLVRLRRVIDIQMDRIRESDLVRRRGAYHLSMSESNAPSIPDKGPIADQRLTSGCAEQVSKIETDFVSLTDSQVFATIRLGYDVCKAHFHSGGYGESRFPRRAVDIHKFWDNLRHKAAGPGELALLTALVASVKPRFASRLDMWRHLPGFERRLLALWIAITMSAVVAVCVMRLGRTEAYPAGDPVSAATSILSTADQSACMEDIAMKAYVRQPLEGGASEVSTFFFLGTDGNGSDSDLGTVKIQMIRLGAITSGSSVTIHARTSSSSFNETHIYILKSGVVTHAASSSETSGPYVINEVSEGDAICVVAGYEDGIQGDLYKEYVVIEVDDYASSETIRYLFGEGARGFNGSVRSRWDTVPSAERPTLRKVAAFKARTEDWANESISQIRRQLLPSITTSFVTHWRDGSVDKGRDQTDDTPKDQVQAKDEVNGKGIDKAKDGKRTRNQVRETWKATLSYLMKGENGFPGNWVYDQRGEQKSDTLHILQWEKSVAK